jgi:hypothetical protein
MSAGHRVADVIRVIDGLGPLRAEQLRDVALLLPQIADGEAGERELRAARAAQAQAQARAATAALATAQTSDAGRDEPAGGRRSRGRRWRWPWRVAWRRARVGALPARLRELLQVPDWVLALDPRRRLLALVALALVASVAVVTQAGWLPTAVVVVLAGLALAIGAALTGRAAVAWWRSPYTRSVARRSAPQLGGDMVLGEAAEVKLERTEWVAPPDAEALVAPGRQRALAIAIAGAPDAGPIDVRRLVDDVAARRRRRAPRREVRRTLRHGVQLLVDGGPALEPFDADVALLTAWLARVASPTGVQRLRFSADPLVVTAPPGRGRSRPQPRPYRELLPRRGCTVLVAGDLGIGQPRSGPLPAPPAAWREHHRLVRQAGCRALYLVPYPAERWPPSLARQLPIVCWRDGLRAEQVLAAVRAGR